MKIFGVITLPGMLVAPVVAQPVPCRITGWVNCANHNHENGPSLTVTNLNTSEAFIDHIL